MPTPKAFAQGHLDLGAKLTSGEATEYKAWHQTKLFAISGSRSTSITYQKDLVAVHAVAMEDGDQAEETPCGLVVLSDVTGERTFDTVEPGIRCEMCRDAIAPMTTS